ncbi:Tyrosine--tRNA ligase [bacterium HR34]|nr:Tyrosine--tRNA ligase [bacterium HR34]
MNIIIDLKKRGLFYQCTEEKELENILNKKKISLYAGFDPTAESLHVGNLLLIITLKRFEMSGHKPIVLVGGATGLIGDPSGKKEERVLNNEQTVEFYSSQIKKQLERFFDFNKKAVLVNNYDWTKNLKVIDFLRGIGKHFSVGYMLAKESVKTRVNTSGISFTEFSYMILQAYDFLQLYKKYGCVLQVGGSDQWGNITAGVDLIKRVEGKEVFGLTTPLITTKEGKKFGKTEKGAVWLDPNKTTPYQFYQFWVNTSDDDVIKFLKYFTFLDIEKINELEEKLKKDPQKREAQKVLAKEVTSFVHGKEAALRAEKVSELLFYGDVKKLSPEDIKNALSDVPHLFVKKQEEKTIIDLLLELGAVKSKREARELLSKKGIYVNGEIVLDNIKISKNIALHNRYFIIKKGKKNYYLVELESV